ncbi:hypothetical protein PC121_g6806 [Phytophthora cactorum]|nr:hypothetical protein PC121_g6806 [Phytophthora cactorum]
MGRGRRPRVNQNGGRRPNQFKNSTPMYEHHLQIVRFFVNNSMKETLARYFPDAQGTTKETKRKSIHLWAKNKAKTERLGSTNATRAMRKLREVGTATVLSKETELQLVTWLNEYRADGAPVSGLMLHLKAREFAEASGVGEETFTASWAWRVGFLKRRGLRFRARTRQGQNSPADSAQAVKELNERMKKEMHRLGSTLEKKGAKTVWVRTSSKDKEIMTCMLLGSSFGEKLTPFLVLKTSPSKIPAIRNENLELRHGFGKHLWKEIKRLQDDYTVQIYGNRTGWWNGGLSIAWLGYNFKYRSHPDHPVLLLWDDFSGH